MIRWVPIVIVLYHFSVIDFSVLFLFRMSFDHRDLRLAVVKFFASCANLNCLQGRISQISDSPQTLLTPIIPTRAARSPGDDRRNVFRGSPPPRPAPPPAGGGVQPLHTI